MTSLLARLLGARGASRLAFSPDGRTLFYVTGLSGSDQLWSLPLEGGGARRLTRDCDRVGAYRISPDGRWIAYGADEGGNERWAIWLMRDDGTEPVLRTDRPDRIHHIVDWTPDGRELLIFQNLRDERYFDLCALPVDGGALRLLLTNDGTGFEATALPDGRVVAAVDRSRIDAQHLLLISTSGADRCLTPDEPMSMHSGAKCYGDGVLVRSDRGRDFVGLAHVGLDGSFAWVVKTEGDIEAFDVAGAGYTYSINVEGHSEVHVANAATERVIEGLPPGALATDLVGGSIAHAANGTVALAWARHDAPTTVWLARPGGKPEVLIAPELAGLSDRELPDTELVSWPTFDGREVPGFLLRPRGVGREPRPTVIQVHGGPESQARPFWDPLWLALVASGVNVLRPNVRGSRGYGRAYMAADDVRLRLDSVRDVDAAAAWLSDAGIAPADRIGVMGVSYGGFMALAAITFFPERNWAAAVDIAGIARWRTYFARTAPWRRALRSLEYGDPKRDADFLDSISPLNHIERVRTPLLVIHGANDPRVPVEEADELVARLRQRGQAVEYVRYADEGHILSKARNRADAWPQVVRFLTKHMGVFDEGALSMLPSGFDGVVLTDQGGRSGPA